MESSRTVSHSLEWKGGCEDGHAQNSLGQPCSRRERSCSSAGLPSGAWRPWGWRPCGGLGSSGYGVPPSCRGQGWVCPCGNLGAARSRGGTAGLRGRARGALRPAEGAGAAGRAEEVTAAAGPESGTGGTGLGLGSAQGKRAGRGDRGAGCGSVMGSMIGSMIESVRGSVMGSVVRQ